MKKKTTDNKNNIKRELHFIFIIGCSGSMSVNGKMESLNVAIREAIPELRDVACGNPNVEMKIRILKYSTGAKWHIKEAVAIEKFEWRDLETKGDRDVGAALTMLANGIDTSEISKDAIAPMMVLFLDGKATDDYKAGLRKFKSKYWGKNGVRLGIPIGDNADNNILEEFIENPNIKPFQANNSEELAAYIKWD